MSFLTQTVYLSRNQKNKESMKMDANLYQRLLANKITNDERKFIIVSITPELAKTLLEHNFNNRKIRTKVVSAYAQDMELGRWRNSPQTISISKKGNLIDGQHRLMALIKAGATIPMAVAYDCEDSYDCIDIGMKRTIRDVIHFSDDTNAVLNDSGMIAAISLLIQTYVKSTWNQSIDDIRNVYRSFEDEITDVYENIGKFHKFNAAIYAAFIAAFIDHEIIKGIHEFMDAIENGNIDTESVFSKNYVIKFMSLCASKSFGSAKGGQNRKRILNITENAVWNFVRGPNSKNPLIKATSSFRYQIAPQLRDALDWKGGSYEAE